MSYPGLFIGIVLIAAAVAMAAPPDRDSPLFATTLKEENGCP